jgi:hypothetical protein
LIYFSLFRVWLFDDFGDSGRLFLSYLFFTHSNEIQKTVRLFGRLLCGHYLVIFHEPCVSESTTKLSEWLHQLTLLLAKHIVLVRGLSKSVLRSSIFRSGSFAVYFD